MRLVFIVLATLFSLHSFSQDTCNLRISLLTCAPGEELYSTFGHTAIRVQDPDTGTDRVFNYGTFEFSPDFYGKFIRGKLLYYLSIEEYQNFYYNYQYESRSIVEQELLLSCNEKQQLHNALVVNALPENRFYRYDFLFDNCTTRARDIISKHVNPGLKFNNIVGAEPPTYRDLIHIYLDKGGQYWSALGIDMLLGARMDKPSTNWEAMFLPEQLLKGMDKASSANKVIAGDTKTLLQMPSPLNKGSLFRPLIVFTVLLVVMIVLNFIKQRWAKRILLAFDRLLFLFLGLSGILMLLMWFGTEHTLCGNNYNLIWALPTHAVVAFFLHRNSNWLKTYFKIVFFLSAALLAVWLFLPQELNIAVLPIVLLVAFRSWFHSKKNTDERNIS